MDPHGFVDVRKVLYQDTEQAMFDATRLSLSSSTGTAVLQYYGTGTDGAATYFARYLLFT